jgi:HK97 family phage prohead protease
MSKMIYKFQSAAAINESGLNDREIRVIASDATPDRAGDIMVPTGCRLDSFRANPIVLANHDPTKPIGTAQPTIRRDRVEALITFAPPRISPIADEFCGLAKTGVLNGCSVGFAPIDSEPLSGGGKRYKEWELLELSIVSVPCNASALVIERSAAAARAVSGAPSQPRLPIGWPAGELTKQERLDFEIRKAIRAEGLMRLEGEAWDAWLALEFPGLSKYAAMREYCDMTSTMPLMERFMLKKRQSDFAKSLALPEIADIEARIKRRVATLAKDSDVDAFRWNPSKNAAENLHAMRARENERIRHNLGAWR